MATVTISGNNASLRITYTETTNTSANTSTVTITKVEGYVTISSTYFLDGKILINGTSTGTYSAFQGTTGRWMAANTWYEFAVPSSPTVTVPHNSDGSVTLTFSIGVNDYSKFYFVKGDGTSSRCSIDNGTSVSAAGTKINRGAVRIYTSGGWKEAIPYIYTGGEWKQAQPYIYNAGGWKLCN